MKNPDKLKQIISSFYGKMCQHNYSYADTDALLFGCDFCRNANICDELTHDNDLSYKPCGSTDKGFRMLFQTGDKRFTQLIVEQLVTTGIGHNKLEWQSIASFTPKYCPFCGRPLFENFE